MEIKNIKENKISIIKKILPNLNLDFINFKIINSNIDTLSKVFETIKSIYSKLSNNINDYDIELDITDSKLKKNVQKHIHSYIDSSNSKILSSFKTWNKIFSIQYENLHFFYLYIDEKTLKKDLNKILFMFKIFISLTKFTTRSDSITRYVIWIPIDSDRDFHFNEINLNNLKECIKHYKAFTVSGVTHGCYNCNNNNNNNNLTNSSDPRITIITRYEEIEKLLIHELVHNLYLDGSNHHFKLDGIINKYNSIKSKNNYNYEFSIYESYTELLSTYFYLLFKNINEPVANIKKILFGQILIEIIYSYNTIVNIAKLNKYQNYNDFIQKEELTGSICFYEYYYIKGLLYNHLILCFPKNLNEFVKLYEQIIRIGKNSSQDKLLEHMFENNQKQENYKYIIN